MGQKTSIELRIFFREKLIDDLMFSDADAGAIVSMHEKESEEAEQAKGPKFSTGVAAQNVSSGTLSNTLLGWVKVPLFGTKFLFRLNCTVL